MRPWHQPHPEDAAIDAARAELAARDATLPAAVVAAERTLAKATARLHAAEMSLRICRRLGHDDTLALLAVTHAQEAVSVASDALIELLDVMARRDAA